MHEFLNYFFTALFFIFTGVLLFASMVGVMLLTIMVGIAFGVILATVFFVISASLVLSLFILVTKEIYYYG